MLIKAALLPVLTLVALTLGLLLAMGRRRVATLRRGEVRMQDIALRQDAWPNSVKQISAAYQNQFEIPLLFYVCVALAAPLHKVDLIFVVLEWIFVISRAVHAYIHVTSNHVPSRFRAFLVGVATLVLMWSYFALRVLLA
jgi:hypothetical protein